MALRLKIVQTVDGSVSIKPNVTREAVVGMIRPKKLSFAFTRRVKYALVNQDLTRPLGQQTLGETL